jgi:hypothetical protein
MIILSMSGLRRMELSATEHPNPVGRAAWGSAAAGAILILMGLNLTYVVGEFEIIQPWTYVSGRVSRAEYITRYRREYPVIEYANQHLPKDARILAFYLGNRTYYSDRNMDCRYPLFFDSVKRAQSADEIYQELRRRGFSNLIIRVDMFRDYVDGSLGQAARARLSEFFGRHVRELRVENGYALLALVEATQPAGARNGPAQSSARLGPRG